MRTTEFPLLPRSRNCRALVHSAVLVSSDKEFQVTNVKSFTVVSKKQYHVNVRKSRTCVTAFFRVLTLSSVFVRSLTFPQKGNYSCQNYSCIACLGPFLVDTLLKRSFMFSRNRVKCNKNKIIA